MKKKERTCYKNIPKYMIAYDGTIISQNPDKKVKNKHLFQLEFVSTFNIRKNMSEKSFNTQSKYRTHFTKVGDKVYILGTTNNTDKITSLFFKHVDNLKEIFDISKEINVDCEVGVFLNQFDTFSSLEEYLKGVDLSLYTTDLQLTLPFSLDNLRKSIGYRIIREGDKLFSLTFNPLGEFIYNAAKDVQSGYYCACFDNYNIYSRYDHARLIMYYTQKSINNNVIH